MIKRGRNKEAMNGKKEQKNETKKDKRNKRNKEAKGRTKTRGKKEIKFQRIYPDVNYSVPCEKCGVRCIGETGQHFCQRRKHIQINKAPMGFTLI